MNSDGTYSDSMYGGGAASSYYGEEVGYTAGAIGGGYGDPTVTDEGGFVDYDPTLLRSSAVDLADTTPPGSYYLLPQELLVSNGGDTHVGSAITATAYDKEYNAIYAATVTEQQHTSSISRSGGGGVGIGTIRRPMRNSIMSIFNNDGVLYSTFAGHPEAPDSTLDYFYDALYGSKSSSTAVSATAAASVGRADKRPCPPHAYQAPYGRADPALTDAAAGIRNVQLSITSAIPGPGFCTTASPAGVRMHALGGYCMADLATLAALAATDHPSSRSHVLVAGREVGPDGTLPNKLVVEHGRHSVIQSLDLWNGLRTVSTTKIDATTVTALQACRRRNCVVAGCTDGTLLLLDDRSHHKKIAEIKSHLGGVVNIAVADHLIATTGYGSVPKTRNAHSPLFAYPDPTVLINDVRYLGRGGFPHPFAGGSGPRYLAFVPSTSEDQQQRLLVASGQPSGSFQIMVPFDASATMTSFLVPPLGRGEATTSLAVDNDDLAIATNQGRILQYKLARDKSVKPMPSPAANEGFRGRLQGSIVQLASAPKKKNLEIPPFEPKPPLVSIDARILLNDTPGTRGGTPASLRSVFGSYILASDPIVSALGSSRFSSTFGLLASQPLILSSKGQVSDQVLSKASSHSASYSLQTISTSDLALQLLESHMGKPNKKTSVHANPNKLIYSTKLHKTVYKESLNRSKIYGRQSRRRATAGTNSSHDEDEDDDRVNFPNRYRLKLRPTHKLAASFNHSDFNQSDVVPGYDYPMTMPNSFVPPVLLQMYFIPELREAALKSQHNAWDSSEDSLLIELGFLYYRIDTIARRALLVPAEDGVSNLVSLGAWAPSSFISCLSAMPEAERFQILDGSPAAIDPPRRPEAFYRFLLYQIENNDGAKGRSLLGNIFAADFVAINEFISGSIAPTNSITRQFTIELQYDHFYNMSARNRASFGDVLQFNLARATRLRAWNGTSKAYETIVQRKIITSLPSILSLSANCAGRKSDEGLSLWQNRERWLPDEIEMELEEDGSVIVRELRDDGTWSTCNGDGSLPPRIAAVVAENTQSGVIRRLRYRLESVVSLIRDDMDRHCPEEALAAAEDDGRLGHHVLHARVPRAFRKKTLQHQKTELKKFMALEQTKHVSECTLLGRGCSETTLHKRLEHVGALIDGADNEPESEWILVNGFVVSKTSVDDVRDFSAKFREPSLIVYRAIEESTISNKGKVKLEANLDIKVPIEVLRTKSLSSHSRPPPMIVPNHRDLIAFDAEFVSIADEESVLTMSGSKVVVRETRHAVARISLILNGNQLVADDHIMPRERVTDYLTRFSGIESDDLNPKRSSRHLISQSAGYLKLRALIERGCIFVGHGLQQDFWTANLAVPAHQIIDTVDIYHKPAQRYISLRFLTNFVLKRDMQQDVHDSVEDALAAFELYRRAVELKAKNNGEFEQLLEDLYALGQKTDWKLGIDEAV